MKLSLALAFSCIFSAANAGDTIVLMVDELELPPYTQEWFATPADGNWTRGTGVIEKGRGFGASDFEVYIRGSGKIGYFYGVLALHCAEPEQSSWLATAGTISEDYVPPEAIAKLRQELC